MTLFDQSGREVMKPIDRELMVTGRYSVEIDAHDLVPGTYMLELRYGSDRIVEKLAIVR